MQIAIGMTVGRSINPASAPTAPSGLSVGSATTSALTLTWTDNSANETGFEVERSANGSTGWTNIATTAANVTSYQNTGLSAGTTYYYRVRAVNATGSSSYTSVANGSTTAEATALSFVNKTTPAGGVDTNITVNVPAGVVNGDMLLMAFASGATPTLSGWTLVDSVTGAAGIYLWKRTASSEPASYTITCAFAWRAAAMLAYHSTTATSIIAGTPANQTNSSSTNIGFASVTAAKNAQLICVGTTDGNGGGTIAPHSGMTERCEIDAGSVLTLYVMDQLIGDAGSTGTRTATVGSAKASKTISATIVENV